MKTLKKLPFVLAFAVALIVGACSDVELIPTQTDEKQTPIVLPPPGPNNTVATDSTTLG